MKALESGDDSAGSSRDEYRRFSTSFWSLWFLFLRRMHNTTIMIKMTATTKDTPAETEIIRTVEEDEREESFTSI